MSFSETIRKLRIDSGFSQQDVAERVGVARATYINLENNRREPNLTEIKKISELYDLSPQELIEGNVAKPEAVHAYIFDEPLKKSAIISTPTFDENKLREVLIYILNKVGGKPNVGETVLYKLLYFIDFDYYEKNGKSITGLSYVRNHYGPTPKKTLFDATITGMENEDEIEIVKTKFFKNNQRKYLATKKPLLNKLSADELNHINKELARLSDKTATELSDLSHKDIPWIVAKPNKPIEYRHVYYRTDATAVTEPEDEL